MKHFPFIILQAANLEICHLSDEVADLLKKFRFRKQKNMAAIVCEYSLR